MSKMYEGVMQGLEEVLAYRRGELKDVTVHKVSMKEVRDFTPAEVKQIRLACKMTQQIFAFCIGVSQKSVEAWEGGRSKPDGAARRFLGLMQDNPEFAREMGIYVKD